MKGMWLLMWLLINREIKFRYIVKHIAGGAIIPLTYALEQIECGEMDEFLLSGRYEILHRSQYTGLKDKNGKEIYEGDIVEYKDESSRVNRLVVKWNGIDASFDFGWVRTRYASTNGEVIGNIYENPDLLEDKNNE